MEMEKINIKLALIVIVVIVAGYFVLEKTSLFDSYKETSKENEIFVKDDLIITKHQYKDGEHVFIFRVDLPSSCHILSSRVVKGEPTQILLSSRQEETADCQKVKTTKTIANKIVASEDAEFIVKLDGEDIKIQQTEIAADVNVFSSEIFFKD